MVLESIKRHMAAVGVYDGAFARSGAELRVVAEELERLYDEPDQGMEERFLSTATGEGLSVYEEIFGPAHPELSAAERRARLRLRIGLAEGDFTPSGIRSALDSFGLEYTISEFPRLYRLNILATADYTEAEQAFIRQEVAKIVPAHLIVQMVFNTLTWSELDSRNRSFAVLDGENLTWEQIDALSNN